MRFNQNYFSYRSRLLAILVGLDMLAQLGHDGAELQMELAEVAVSLQLGAQLVVRLLLLVDRVVAVAGRSVRTNAVVLVKVHGVLVSRRCISAAFLG